MELSNARTSWGRALCSMAIALACSALSAWCSVTAWRDAHLTPMSPDGGVRHVTLRDGVTASWGAGAAAAAAAMFGLAALSRRHPKLLIVLPLCALLLAIAFLVQFELQPTLSY